MKDWEIFEINATEYLNGEFGSFATFTRKGGADSNVPDIEVISHKGECFYFEAKKCPAQCGQFVALPDIVNKCFKYSPKNFNVDNIFSKRILEHMNNFFEEFKEAGTAGKDISFTNDTKTFIDWVTQIYKSKNVRYIITNNYMIVPIKNFGNYFDITAKYRIKRSGSSDVGKGNIPSIKNCIDNMDYNISSVFSKDKKLFVTSPEDLHNKRFYFKDYEYMFSKRDNIFEVRKLSNTFNANVIFSITLKDNAEGVTPIEFK